MSKNPAPKIEIIEDFLRWIQSGKAHPEGKPLTLGYWGKVERRSTVPEDRLFQCPLSNEQLILRYIKREGKAQ